jgi:hypothetical protein
MAVRWLISGGGNFSSTSVWNDGTLLGIPTTGDDVFTNGFTVNMDTNATVNSLNNSARARDIATPQMTANNAPSPYVAAASSIFAAGNDAWRAFDRSTANIWQTPNGTTTGWLSMDFGSAIIIDAYTVFGTSTQSVNPRNWTFEGSSNNVSWTTLHTVTLPSAIAASSSYSSGSISNPTAYRYYRINITLNGGGTGVGIAELELYQPGTAALASGGSFNFNTAGVTVSATSVGQAVSNIFTITNTTGTATLSVANNITAANGQTTLTYSGAGNFTFTCPNIFALNQNISNTVVNKTGAGTLTFNGNSILLGIPGGQTVRCIVSTNGNVIVNGDVKGSPSTGINGTNRTLDISGGNLTINGNITPTSVPSANNSTANCSVFFSGTTLTLNGNTEGGDGLAIVSTGTVNVTGTLVGGNSVFANNTITINVTGDVYAGLAPAINCNLNAASQASTVNLTGNMYNTLGRMAIWCPNVFISNTATTLWRMDTGGGNYKFLYSADSTPNLPPQTDVRFGTTFGPSLSLTGTMVTVSAANTRKDVPTDNTVGTGELTSADIISGINASSDSLALRLKNTLTDTTAGNIISQYNNS